jgi:superfamily II DNA or RNA helicase
VDVSAGSEVEARRAWWTVRAARRRDPLALLHLVARDACEPAARDLLSPFDRIVPAGPQRPVRVSRRRWMRALRRLAGEACPFDVPASAAATGSILLPFQIEPLLALRAGLATRLLIADEVGLGKTVQAGLVARDVADRSPGASTLVVAPAGLRRQWREELRDRAGLEATEADASWLRALESTLPPGVNPWHTAPLFVVSIDFVKQPEVLRGAVARVWSLLVVDEAHVAAPATGRFDAVAALAARSERVLLLTATPHDGDEARFAALCAIGRLGRGDRLAVFRRTRESLPRPTPLPMPPRRVVCRLRVSSSAAEDRLHRLLERYVRRVWTDAPEETRAASRLAMSVLVKRAASSPWALAQSLARRRDLVAGRAPASIQSPLDFGDAQAAAAAEEADAAPDAVLGAVALAPDRERTWLNLLAHAASAASAGERKLVVLERLLRRTREAAIVFTEYRDTLQRIAAALATSHRVACLHGGLDADARRRALEAFASGEARILLSTDAGSQGLNLQRAARLVVHVELPWSPLRLDQRNGRVDRIGQTRAVHIVQLVGRGTIEARIEARLGERRRRIDAAMDRGSLADTAILGAAITTADPFDSPSVSAADAAPASGGAGPARDALWPDLSREAARSVAHLDWLRVFRPDEGGTGPAVPPQRTRLTRRGARRLGLGRGWLAVHRTRLRDGSGAIRDTGVVVHHLACDAGDPEASPPLAALRRRLDAVALERLDEVRRASARADEAVASRRREWLRLEAARRQPDQLVLFDEHAPPGTTAERARPTHTDSSPPVGAWSAEVTEVLLAVIE